MSASTTIRSIYGLALLACATLVPADEHEIRWYDVEVVIFENVRVPRSSNTKWNPQAYIPLLENAVSLAPGDEIVPQQPIVIDSDALANDVGELVASSIEPRILERETHRLAIEAAAIEKSSRYKLLVHQAWRQAGTPLEQAIPIHIRRGEPIPAFAAIANFTELPEVHLVPQPDTPPPLPGALEIPRAEPPPIPTVDNFQPVFARPPNDQFGAFSQILAYPLDGTITVSLSRFLHVYTDLALTKTGLSNTGYDLQSFIVQSHRRMRSRKLHYIDHPKIGILVLITPYDPEQES